MVYWTTLDNWTWTQWYTSSTREVRSFAKVQQLNIPKILCTLSSVSISYERSSSSSWGLPRAYKIKNIFSRLARLRSGHAVLCPFFQHRYSTVLDEKSHDLLSVFFRRAARNCYWATVTKWEFAILLFANFNIIVLGLMSTYSFQYKIWLVGKKSQAFYTTTRSAALP